MKNAAIPRGERDTGRVSDDHHDGDRPPGPVRDVAGGAGEGLVVVPLLGLEGDHRGGVEPLAVLQHVIPGPHILDNDMTIAIMPVNLE